jgi:hypothetical protein
MPSSQMFEPHSEGIEHEAPTGRPIVRGINSHTPMMQYELAQSTFITHIAPLARPVPPIID